jgi:uncharacterized coiled-coil protein SlyX
MEELESRLVSLEEKYMHQDHLVTELNSIVAKQAQTIEALISYLKGLESSNDSSAPALSLDNLKDEVPPHY